MIIPKEPTKNNNVRTSTESEFDHAFEQLTKIVDLSQADEMMPSSPQTVYTASVVLWLLIVQRLKNGCSLHYAVEHLLDTYPDLLPDNKRVDKQNLSPNTGAYSNGRKRLTMDVARWLSEKVSQSLIDESPPAFAKNRVFMLDGTTITLQPESELRKIFPPATNQFGESPWPTANLVVAHELTSGVALSPEVGAMYGPEAVSETSLIYDHLARIPAGSVILADASYGIYRVAYAAQQTQKRFLLRMTKSRFQSQCKKAKLVAEGPNWKTYEHLWKPSAKALSNNPQIPKNSEMKVQLHEIEISEKETLYLVTDLSEDAEELAELYSLRWSVETDISNLKLALNIENIRAKSEQMFHKELLISTVAYNLCCQFRRQAASVAEVHPRRLSFTYTWNTFKVFLLEKISTDPSHWRSEFDRALKIAAKHKLPHRPERGYRREAYKRRPKSTHFEKREPPWKRAA